MSGIKSFICIVIAAAMLFLSIIIMYPGMFHVQQVEEAINQLTEGEDVGLESFPFYGNNYAGEDGVYGMYTLFTDCAPFITGDDPNRPDIGGMLKDVVASTQTLFNFLVLSLLSIPVYMVLRLIPFNTLYAAVEDYNWLARIFVKGITTVCAGVVTVCFTWFLYHSVVLKNLLSLLGEETKNIQKPTVVLNVTNVVIIIVAVLLVYAILKTTLFRGSVTISILLGVLRTLLFVVFFAYVNVFAGQMTARVVLYGIAGIIACGVLKDLISPEKQEKKSK